jgi:hypothetical protein
MEPVPQLHAGAITATSVAVKGKNEMIMMQSPKFWNQKVNQRSTETDADVGADQAMYKGVSLQGIQDIGM